MTVASPLAARSDSPLAEAMGEEGEGEDPALGVEGRLLAGESEEEDSWEQEHKKVSPQIETHIFLLYASYHRPAESVQPYNAPPQDEVPAEDAPVRAHRQLQPPPPQLRGREEVDQGLLEDRVDLVPLRPRLPLAPVQAAVRTDADALDRVHLHVRRRAERGVGRLLEKDILCFPAFFFTKMKMNKDFLLTCRFLTLCTTTESVAVPAEYLRLCRLNAK